MLTSNDDFSKSRMNENIKQKKSKNFISITKYLIKENKNPKIILIEYISVAKVLATFSVVILHTNGAFWNFSYINYKKYWISANKIESIFYFAVPFFVLCIGATLLDFNEKYGLKKYFYKRIIKVVIPLILWNIILYIFRVYIIRNMNKQKLNFINIWNIYYKNKIYSIFGSFHIFLISYFIIPLLAYVEKTKKIKIYSYCFISILITQALFPYFISLFKLKIEWVYNINIGYTIYIFAGYILHNFNFKLIWKIIIYRSA